MANILIIDDDSAVCDILKTALETHDHEVQAATDAHNLPDLLASRPDVVLLDVCMPETNGLECLPHIQRLSPGSRVVIITGVNDYHVADLFYELGVAGFLTKPIRLDHLKTTIDRILDTTARAHKCP